MSQYLVLSHIEVQNANSIAGFTWGFPAITGFLGFTHALSRKVSQKFGGEYDTSLSGCVVISNTYQNKVYQPKQYADFEFIQSRNPPVLEKNKNGKKVPVIEEGKMNLIVSLVIELDKQLLLTDELVKKFEKTVLDYCYQLRLAGGSILNIKQAKLLSENTSEQQVMMLKKIKRLAMPGFVLLDRSAYLEEHYQNLLATNDYSEDVQTALFDAWLDFCALKSKAVPKLAESQTEPDMETDADWHYQPKPKTGYLVPLMTGFKAISQVYDTGKVANTRDNTTPSCFVEAIHSVGEWKGVHSLTSISSAMWRYHHDGQWYLCRQGSNTVAPDHQAPDSTQTNEVIRTLNFEDALNNW
ncbi:type I-F CRISPR-associated protein Csy2 [Salinivibrio costicola]|uniref:Type I-F CRISPR-associated protein Csy2 n=1 Tax=Salinivibrio costicola subsp. alcaliphilus TaxID=272773 RepID=A0ABX3KM99_SALCS|nr:type I-F CRISPR-associated protein Csy2 [Salinivibrio costicola]OOF32725.1 type I-F CRISPR-associated protein Csy2 [Salinivibrio costicola subsp. alcaliphilus]